MSNPLFATVPLPKLKRSTFNMSHEKKLTGEIGKLIPILCLETIPGDTFSVSTEVLIRMAPMLAPVMHRVNVYAHYFKVPYRLLWKGFRDFITGGPDGTSNPAMPSINIAWAGSHREGDGAGNLYPESKRFLPLGPSSLWDYLGLPTGDDLPNMDSFTDWKEQMNICMLPFYAYQLIFNEYYRDENLQDEIEIPVELDGTVISEDPNLLRPLFELRNRCWEKDYFSGALPWPQRGEDVALPMHGDASLSFTGKPGTSVAVQGYMDTLEFDSEVPIGASRYFLNGSGGKLRQQWSSDSGIVAPTGSTGASLLPNGTLSVDPAQIAATLEGKANLSNVTSATINELRRAFAAQRFLENNARGGSRYIEVIESHFGVRSSDARLQRPEYLGGGKAKVVISEVTQTGSDAIGGLSGIAEVVTPVGDMYGHGISVGNTMTCRTFCEEHGVIMGILSVVPKPTYQQGVPRMFLRSDKFDFAWPEFAHLGEQEVYNGELYAKCDNPMETFGYVPRYSEYKFLPSTVHGDFKTVMNYWHLGRIFKSQPQLNGEFVQVDETDDDLARIFSAQYDVSESKPLVYQHLWMMLYNKVYAKRPLPRYGVPRL